jgi:hypothetical protein
MRDCGGRHDDLSELLRARRGRYRPDHNTSDRRLGRRRRSVIRSLGQVCRNALANAQRLHSVPSDRARIDFGASGETGVGRSKCAAQKTTDRCQTDVEVTEAPGEQRPRTSQAFCSVLPVADNASTRSLLASVRVAEAGSTLRIDDVECGPERKAWGIKYRAIDVPWRRRRSDMTAIGFSAPCCGRSKRSRHSTLTRGSFVMALPSQTVLRLAKDIG